MYYTAHVRALTTWDGKNGLRVRVFVRRKPRRFTRHDTTSSGEYTEDALLSAAKDGSTGGAPLLGFLDDGTIDGMDGSSTFFRTPDTRTIPMSWEIETMLAGTTRAFNQGLVRPVFVAQTVNMM